MSSLTVRAALCCVVVIVLIGAPPFSDAQLDPSFYNSTCSNVHSIVLEVLRNVSKSDPRILGSLMRLHFHDCFVQVRIFLLPSLYVFGLSLTIKSTFNKNPHISCRKTFFYINPNKRYITKTLFCTKFNGICRRGSN